MDRISKTYIYDKISIDEWFRDIISKGLEKGLKSENIENSLYYQVKNGKILIKYGNKNLYIDDDKKEINDCKFNDGEETKDYIKLSINDILEYFTDKNKKYEKCKSNILCNLPNPFVVDEIKNNKFKYTEEINKLRDKWSAKTGNGDKKLLNLDEFANRCTDYRWKMGYLSPIYIFRAKEEIKEKLEKDDNLNKLKKEYLKFLIGLYHHAAYKYGNIYKLLINELPSKIKKMVINDAIKKDKSQKM